MYEKIAWNHFLKTGDIESYLEYRRLTQINENIEQYNDYEINKIYQNILKEQEVNQNIGESTSEFNKDKGDRNQRGLL